MTPEEVRRIRQDERARVLFYLQRRFRIINQVRELYYPQVGDQVSAEVWKEQAMLDMIGWLAQAFSLDFEMDHYDFVVPPNDEESRSIEQNVWKIVWE